MAIKSFARLFARLFKGGGVLGQRPKNSEGNLKRPVDVLSVGNPVA